MVSGDQRNNRYFYLSRSLKQLGKYVGRGKRQSIAKAAIENSALRGEIVAALCTAAHKEMIALCSDSHDSILCMKTKPALELFSWERVWLELQQHAPLLLDILTKLLPPSKRGAKSIQPALCVCASILLKLRSNKVNLVQTMIAVVLRAGHATKQV